jgi:hypothetical protein
LAVWVGGGATGGGGGDVPGGGGGGNIARGAITVACAPGIAVASATGGLGGDAARGWNAWRRPACEPIIRRPRPPAPPV